MRLGIYKHSKTGNEYKVHFIAKDGETLENIVVYEALYENNESKFWVRPQKIFEEIVDINGKQVPRFVWIREK